MDENIMNAIVGRVIKYLEKNNPLSHDNEEDEYPDEYFEEDEDEEYPDDEYYDDWED